MRRAPSSPDRVRNRLLPAPTQDSRRRGATHAPLQLRTVSLDTQREVRERVQEQLQLAELESRHRRLLHAPELPQSEFGDRQDARTRTTELLHQQPTTEEDSQRLRNLEGHLLTLVQEVQSLRTDRSTVTERIKSLQTDCNGTLQELQSLQANCDVLVDKTRCLTERIQSLEAECESQAQAIRCLQTEMSQLRADGAQAQTTMPARVEALFREMWDAARERMPKPEKLEKLKQDLQKYDPRREGRLSLPSPVSPLDRSAVFRRPEFLRTRQVSPPRPQRPYPTPKRRGRARRADEQDAKGPGTATRADPRITEDDFGTSPSRGSDSSSGYERHISETRKMRSGYV